MAWWSMIKYVFGSWPECHKRFEKGQIDIQVYIAYSKEKAIEG